MPAIPLSRQQTRATSWERIWRSAAFLVLRAKSSRPLRGWSQSKWYRCKTLYLFSWALNQVLYEVKQIYANPHATITSHDCNWDLPQWFAHEEARLFPVAQQSGRSGVCTWRWAGRAFCFQVCAEELDCTQLVLCGDLPGWKANWQHEGGSCSADASISMLGAAAPWLAFDPAGWVYSVHRPHVDQCISSWWCLASTIPLCPNSRAVPGKGQQSDIMPGEKSFLWACRAAWSQFSVVCLSSWRRNCISETALVGSSDGLVASPTWVTLGSRRAVWGG